MAFVLADRVRETTTTNGTGAIYPSGVVTGGYQTFNSVLSNGDTTLCLVRNDAGQWQTFLGTWNSGTQSMARTTAYEGSDGAGVNVGFSGTAQEIWIDYPAAAYLDPLFQSATIGRNSANYGVITGGASGAPWLFSAAGSDTNVGVGLVPKGDYMATTTRMLIGPQSSWAAAQTSNATRLRTQLAAFHSSFVHTSGQEFYPQFSVTGGSQSGTVNAGDRHGHSVMSIDNDNLVTVAGGSGPEGLALLYLGVGAGNASGAAGGAHAGGRTAIDANIFVNSDVDVGAGTIFHVALAGNTTAYRRMGGVPGSHRGNVFGSLLAARGQNLGGTGPGPRYLNSIVGLEVDVEQQANVTALWKMGIQIVAEADEEANALQQNIGLGFINQPSATTPGWDQVISFSGYNGQFSAASNGQLIATTPTPIGLNTFAAADGMNLARIAFSRAAIETPGLYVDGSGNLGGEKVGGLSLQTVSAVNAKVSTVSSITVVEGGVYDGPTLISTTGTYSGGSTAVTVASFAGISNGMIIAGADITPGTTVVSGAGTVNLVISAVTTGPGTDAAITFVTPNRFPTYTLASPATSGGVSGTTATMTVTNMGAIGFTGVTTGGNGLYVAGETLTAVGGTGTAFTIYIETVTAGVPTNIRVATAGNYTVIPTNPVSFTGSAAGTGFTLGMRWKVLTVSNTAGTNYNELRPPIVTFTGSMTQTREARFKLAMSAGTSTTLALNHGSDVSMTGRYTMTTTNTPSTALTPFIRSNQTMNGAITTGNSFFNDINTVDNCDASAVTGAHFWYLGHTYGTSMKGDRSSLKVVTAISGRPADSASSTHYYVGIQGNMTVGVDLSNGAGTYVGNAIGQSYDARVTSGGEVSILEAMELGAGVLSGGAAQFVNVLKLSPMAGGTSGGGALSYNGLAFSSASGDTGLSVGIAFGGAEGTGWPIATGGKMIAITNPSGSPAKTVDYGIDFQTVACTFTTAAFASPGFTLDGAGGIIMDGALVAGDAIETNTEFYVSGTQVVSARKTGWTAATGTSSRATFATTTVTTEQLAQRVKALLEDLTAHGLVGT